MCVGGSMEWKFRWNFWGEKKTQFEQIRIECIIDYRKIEYVMFTREDNKKAVINWIVGLSFYWVFDI